MVDVLGVPVLVGLFGVAVALGTLGRVWSGPATFCRTSTCGGRPSWRRAASVLVNNLPAASLLAARDTGHPFALLIGLNLGPNLFVTGSLAWFLWLRAARTAAAALDRQGQPSGCDRRAAVDGRRPRCAGPDRVH